MREATVYGALLTSAQGFFPDLARHLTGKALKLQLTIIHIPSSTPSASADSGLSMMPDNGDLSCPRHSAFGSLSFALCFL